MVTKHPFILEVAAELALPQALLTQASEKFGSDKARDCAMSTSVGGIGPLLKDRLLEQADQDLDMIAVSLLYENVWVQTKDRTGKVRLKKKSVGDELRALLTKAPFELQFDLFGEQTKVEVWTASFGKAKAYFLSSTHFTDIIYPGGVDAPKGTGDPGYWAHRMKLQQNCLLGRGALWLCKKLNKKPDTVVLSETQAIFSHHKIFKDALQNDPFFGGTKYIFNDHTPLEYAHPQWDEHTTELTNLDPNVFLNSKAWNEETKHVDVSSLAVDVCDGVFGVAKKHARVMREMPSMKRNAKKIQAITNGIHQTEWQAKELREPEKLSDEELLKIKESKKQLLVDWLKRSLSLPSKWIKKNKDKNFVLLTRRITGYKRLDVLSSLLFDPELRKTFLSLNIILVIGGRVHQQDDQGGNLLSDLIRAAQSTPALAERVLFITNFNVWEAPLLYQGAEASIMMSDNNKEASATGFMKMLLNGGGVVATKDGAIPEFVDFSKDGFEIVYVNKEPTTKALLDALSKLSQTLSDPKKYTAMMRSALSKTPLVGIQRTVREMKKLYSQLNNELEKIP